MKYFDTGKCTRKDFLRLSLLLLSAGIGTVFLKREPTGPAPQIPKPASEEDLWPGYVFQHRSGELKRRAQLLWSQLDRCRLCPRKCQKNRLGGQPGFCRATQQLVIASYHPHFGEERPLVGRGGSGTIFLSHCNLRCVFCINGDISHEGLGREASIAQCARMMLDLQEQGCHNLNVVTPTHYLPHILLALDEAARQGLRLPLVYNTCGRERLEVLRMLDGIVDVYLPDFKYADGNMAARFSAGARSYPSVTQQALLEMHRQVGVARVGADGLIRRGLMIRHLVMPNQVGGTKEVVAWISRNLPKDTYVNLMSQYTPVYRAKEYPLISRKITTAEYDQAVAWARQAGLTQLEIQGGGQLF